MAMTPEENDLITRVDNDAPLGGLLRDHYWIPAIPSIALEADGEPRRIRLLGRNYVAFRNTDGRAGIVDEACPHRRASLALGRNEENGLRCIYHGWKFDVTGKTVEVPNIGGNQERFCESVKFPRYTVEDRGGIVWVWFGQQGTAPRFPNFPFTELPENQRAVTSTLVPTNWLQGVEATMDTTHASFLHQSYVAMISGSTERMNMAKSQQATFEFEDRPYGFRYAAMRALPDGNTYSRVNNFVMPWYGIICPPETHGPSTVFFSVPVDDDHHRAWFVHFNLNGPLGMTPLSASPDVCNYPPLPPGGPDNNWGQNRGLMKRGYYSGFPQHFATEDFAMFLSQGPIHDRSLEQLCASDAAIIKLRGQLLKSVREYAAGQSPEMARHKDLDYSMAISFGGVYGATETWRNLISRFGERTRELVREGGA